MQIGAMYNEANVLSLDDLDDVQGGCHEKPPCGGFGYGYDDFFGELGFGPGGGLGVLGGVPGNGTLGVLPNGQPVAVLPNGQLAIIPTNGGNPLGGGLVGGSLIGGNLVGGNLVGGSLVGGAPNGGFVFGGSPVVGGNVVVNPNGGGLIAGPNTWEGVLQGLTSGAIAPAPNGGFGVGAPVVPQGGFGQPAIINGYPVGGIAAGPTSPLGTPIGGATFGGTPIY